MNFDKTFVGKQFNVTTKGASGSPFERSELVTLIDCVSRTYGRFACFKHGTWYVAWEDVFVRSAYSILFRSKDCQTWVSDSKLNYSNCLELYCYICCSDGILRRWDTHKYDLVCL